MTTSNHSHSAASNNATLRDPSEWKTGDEPITTAQRSYIETLSTEAGEPAKDVDDLSKADASVRIEELQEKTGRGQTK